MQEQRAPTPCSGAPTCPTPPRATTSWNLGEKERDTVVNYLESHGHTLSRGAARAYQVYLGGQAPNEPVPDEPALGAAAAGMLTERGRCARRPWRALEARVGPRKPPACGLAAAAREPRGGGRVLWSL